MAPEDATLAIVAYGIHQHNSTLTSEDVTMNVLGWLRILYPVVLLFLFVVALAAHGIINSSAGDEVMKGGKKVILGPGGKPLPVAPRKKQNPIISFGPNQRLLFMWLSIGLIVTFGGNILDVLAHALVKRSAAKEGGWWCGQEFVVSCSR